MEHEQKQQLSTPNAIILAGIIIAGAILLTNYNSANKKTSSFDTDGNINLAQENSVAGTDEQQVKKSPVLAKLSESDHIRYAGNFDKNKMLKDKKLTIIEYSDLECPFCKVFHPTMQKIVEAYPNQIIWVYRQFPLDSLHSKARTEANATECTFEQGGDTAFWKYLDRIFEITPSNNGLDLTKLSTIATELGLDLTKFDLCIKNDTYKQKVNEQYESGVKAGVEGTPASFIVAKDGTYAQIMGAESFDSIKAKIDKLLIK